eukprot:1160416-Pelagomonas_calceolata.AAC.3
MQAPLTPRLSRMQAHLHVLTRRLSQEYLEQYEDVGFDDLSGADARRWVTPEEATRQKCEIIWISTRRMQAPTISTGRC